MTLKRRTFIQAAAGLVGSAFAIPSIIPARALGKDGNIPASERITMGFIGMGTMGEGHIFGRAWTYLPGGYIARDDVQILAVCDVWKNKRDTYRQMVNDVYAGKNKAGSFHACDAYQDFRELLVRPDIDAVLIATPIHWHATMAVYAANAKKDVYCEKPTAVSIYESQAMRKAFEENNRIFQAGTQQRSEYDGKFRTACEYIRNGRIGELKEVYAFRDGGGVIWNEKHGETTPVPDGFDWDLWLGPAPAMPYQGRSDAHLFGFGGINWGQHHYDIIQWALDADDTGPVEIGLQDGHAVYRYGNGVRVHGCPYADSTISETGGAWFIGTEGKIAVDREHLISEPASILEKPLSRDAIRLYHSDSHSGNFLECVKSRKQPICNIQVAHRAASLMLLGGIAKLHKKPLVWDPQEEIVTNDATANAFLKLDTREEWAI
jgi:predicted dehydrogenase